MSDTSIPQRTCTKCHQSFPATLEYFHYQKKGKFNLSSWCITCHRNRNNENSTKRRENPEYRKKERIRSIEYRQENPDKTKQHNKDYYWDNLERERERVKVNHVRFSEREKKQRRVRDQTEKGRKQQRKDAALYKLRHPERVKAQKKVVKARRRARILNASGSHTSVDIFLQRKAQTDKKGRLHCWWCGKIIKDEDYHLDHVIPLSRGGSNGADNIVLSCPKCNLAKSAKNPQEFAGRLI